MAIRTPSAWPGFPWLVLRRTQSSGTSPSKRPRGVIASRRSPVRVRLAPSGTALVRDQAGDQLRERYTLYLFARLRHALSHDPAVCSVSCETCFS